MSICAGCNKKAKLIKTHIIPEAFFRDIKKKQGSTKLFSEQKGEYPKKSPIGVYDEKILCRECEDKFEETDDYGIKILLTEFDKLQPIYIKKHLIGYKRSDFDYERLKLFFISIIWRASISKQSFFDKVNLGKYENIAKEMLWSGNPGTSDQFSCVIAKFNDDHIGKSMLNPIKNRFQNRNYYQFYLSGYVVYVKVDKQSAVDLYKKYELCQENDLHVVSRNISKSSELQSMISVARSAST